MRDPAWKLVRGPAGEGGLHAGEMVRGMEGMWCGIVICGGIGTEGDGNDEFSGVGVCERGCFCVVPGVGWKF